MKESYFSPMGIPGHTGAMLLHKECLWCSVKKTQKPQSFLNSILHYLLLLERHAFQWLFGSRRFLANKVLDTPAASAVSLHELTVVDCGQMPWSEAKCCRLLQLFKMLLCLMLIRDF